MSDLPAYTPIDLEKWPRREQYEYYTNLVHCGFSVTLRLRVDAVLRYARASGKKFYGCFLYAAAKTVNSLPAMRMMRDENGNPGTWEISHPNFTVFHPETETFSDLWTEYSPDFETFYRGFAEVTERYGSVIGMKPRPNQPSNFFCISCAPWLDYTGMATLSEGAPPLFPIITFGKYTAGADGATTLPLSLEISHTAADGWHASQFFTLLQENLDAFAEME